MPLYISRRLPFYHKGHLQHRKGLLYTSGACFGNALHADGSGSTYRSDSTQFLAIFQQADGTFRANHFDFTKNVGIFAK